MEEKKSTNEKLSYEELEQAALALQKRCIELERAISSFEVQGMRLEGLFRIIEHKELYPVEFVDSCIAELQEAFKFNKDR